MWVLLYRSVLQWKWAYCIIGFPDFVVMSTDTKRNLCNSKTNKQKAVGKLIVCLWCGLYFKPWENTLGKPRLFHLQRMDFNSVTECGFEKQEVMWKYLSILVSQKLEFDCTTHTCGLLPSKPSFPKRGSSSSSGVSILQKAKKGPEGVDDYKEAPSGKLVVALVVNNPLLISRRWKKKECILKRSRIKSKQWNVAAKKACK